MPFIEILKDLVEGVYGGIGAAVMAPDGVVVEKYSRGAGPAGAGDDSAPYDVEAAGVEYGHILVEAKKAASVLNIGDLEELSVGNGRASVILRVASPEYGYYIALALKAGSNEGRARYLLKRAARKAAKEF